MFSKEQRLAKKNDINAVFAARNSAYNNLLGIKYKENELDYSRYTVIISKKVEKSAVKRNKIKRYIKNSLKKQDKKIKKNIDCVVVCLKEVADKEHQEIEKEINILLKRLRLI